MTQHITLGGLPLVNLKRKPFRTAALTIVVAMLTVAFYGGSLLSMNLEAGFEQHAGTYGRRSHGHAAKHQKRKPKRC